MSKSPNPGASTGPLDIDLEIKIYREYAVHIWMRDPSVSPYPVSFGSIVSSRDLNAAAMSYCSPKKSHTTATAGGTVDLTFTLQVPPMPSVM